MRSSAVLGLICCLALSRCGPRSSASDRPAPLSTQTPVAAAPPAPTGVAAHVYRVGGDVTAPIELSRVAPVFPDACKGSRASGIFILNATIDETGRVTDLSTVARPTFDPPCPQLENAYKRAVLQWRYKPATLRGKPVPVSLTVTGTLQFRRD